MRFTNDKLITYSIMTIQKAVIARAKMCETNLDRVTILVMSIFWCFIQYFQLTCELKLHILSWHFIKVISIPD